MKLTLALILILLLPKSILAQSDTILISDSLNKPNTCKYKCEQFNMKHTLLPIGLFAVGAWGISNPWAVQVKTNLKNRLAEWRNGRYIHEDDYGQYLPTLSFMTFEYLGVKPKHNFSERLTILASSYLLMGTIVNSIKHITHERRPDNTAYNSFPSGHTATAFMGVELFRLEYGNKWGIPAYSIAAAIGFLRLHNERHWLNDVIAGAGVGILSAKFGYWMLPCTRRWLHLKSDKQLTVMPQYQPIGNSFGIGIGLQY